MKKTCLIIISLFMLLMLLCGCIEIEIEGADNGPYPDIVPQPTQPSTPTIPTQPTKPSTPVTPTQPSTPTMPTNIIDSDISDNVIKTAYGERGIEFSVSGDYVTVSGGMGDDSFGYVMVILNDNWDSQSSPVMNRKFSKSEMLPQTSNDVSVELYGGPEEYGNFSSIIINYIKLKKGGSGWAFESSPVYAENCRIFSKAKDMQESLLPTDRIQADNAEISKLAKKITSDCNNDYEKTLAIHDWVATNIYYDRDALRSGNLENGDALSVLHSKKAVCEGYANLFAALARSIGIPCRVQGGYALGISSSGTWNSDNINTTEGNHAWNEVYVDGRWIITDSTWDSGNCYEYGEFKQESPLKWVYFDSDIEFFSLSHRLME